LTRTSKITWFLLSNLLTVNSENKKDKRTIEETLADIAKAKRAKNMKL
jgi:hypothetical protein